jgi:hypothetical protein
MKNRAAAWHVYNVRSFIALHFRPGMPMPSSSKLRPGYSLNFRHATAPAADEAAARLPAFTVHIGLGEDTLSFCANRIIIILSFVQPASSSTSCSFFSPQRAPSFRFPLFET